MIDAKKQKTSNLLLEECILKSLKNLEDQGDIIICSSDASQVVKIITQELESLLPAERITISELSSIRSLILYAIEDKNFFDWEMPTLTGLRAEDFRLIAEKLPNI